MDDPREVVVFYLPVLCPWCEVPQLSIISIVSHPHLRSDVKDLVVVYNNTAVVYDVLVHDRPKSTLRRMLSVYSGMIYMPMS